MKKIIVFPSSYFDRFKVDEDLQTEYDAVVSTGLFDVVIFSYDKWFNEGKLLLTDMPESKIIGIYRGWMMKPEQYEDFYRELLERNIQLITTPEEYKQFHVFPNIYPYIEEDTAKMLIYSKEEYKQLNVLELKKHFNRFMIKDFVKSVKGTAFPVFFDQNVTQEEFDKWMEVFYQYRGDLFTGGICVKEYLDLKKYGETTNEFRVFYINHKVAAIYRNSNQQEDTTEPPKELINKYTNLKSSFYTIDYAELEAGEWKIIEAGDGEVSGIPDKQDKEEFFARLNQMFHKDVFCLCYLQSSFLKS